MRARFSSISLLLIAASASAEPAIPPTRQNVDLTHTIAQLDAMRAPCVAIPTPHATLYLSLQRLMDTAAAKPEQIVTEEDAMQILPARRASALLARLDGATDRDNCRTLRSGLEGSDGFVVLNEIRKGAVFVRTESPRVHIPKLHVRYLVIRGESCGSGVIHVALPDQDARLMTLSWWTTYAGACPTVSKPSA